jgi:predicted membrane protein
MHAKTFAAVATAVLLVACHKEPTIATQHESKSIELDKSEQTRVELRMGVGTLKVNGGSQKLAEAEFAYNVAVLKPEVEYHSTGTRSDLKISQQQNVNTEGEMTNEWNIRLNDKVPMDISAHLGVGEAEMNLGSLNLRDVNLQAGVGEVKMDLRGAPARSYDVHIQGGVGEATVYLPNNVGIIATASGAVGDIKVDGLVERDGRYINAGKVNSSVTIRIDVKGGVGDIHLIAE